MLDSLMNSINYDEFQMYERKSLLESVHAYNAMNDIASKIGSDNVNKRDIRKMKTILENVTLNECDTIECNYDNIAQLCSM